MIDVPVESLNLTEDRSKPPMIRRPMYSMQWFDTFAARVPEPTTAGDAAAVEALAPVHEFPRLLDVGCGTGRVASRLSQRGYSVTGIDTNVEALRTARQLSAGVTFLALDQRHVGHLLWVFDAALILWNSLGFSSRDDDLETLRGLARVIRPGGRLLIDLYHPGWLSAEQQRGTVHRDGAAIDRWLENGRCFHRIRYGNGSSDEIAFNVYRPEEIAGMLSRTGFHVDRFMVWWNSEVEPGSDFPRYQVLGERRSGIE